MSSSMTFRAAQLDEAGQIASLINAAFRNERTGQTWLYPDQARRTDIVSPEAIQSAIAKGPDTVVLMGTLATTTTTSPVAEDSIGPGIDCCCILRRPAPDDDDDDASQAEGNQYVTPGSAWLSLLAVRPDLQQRGIGLALLKRAEGYVRGEFGARRLEMDAVSSRMELIDWYRRCGFERTGKERPFDYGRSGREILAEGLALVALGKDL